MKDDPKRLRARADELRAMADVIMDQTSRATMQRIAEDYDRRAKRVEETARTASIAPSYPSPVRPGPSGS